jgi:hypothetical protein
MLLAQQLLYKKETRGKAQMRSTKLLVHFAVAALLVLASAGTAAAVAVAGKHPNLKPKHPNVKHHILAGNCQAGINVAPRIVTVGDPVVIFGSVLCEGVGAAGQTVKLFQHNSGSPGYSFVQSTTTDAAGFYAFTGAAGAVSTRSAWYVRVGSVRSVAKAVRVAAQVTLSGPPDGSQLLTGPANKVTFTGTVNPNDAGSAVVLQRQDAATGGTWHRIDAIGTVGAGGGFSIVHTFVFPGDANIRVVVFNRAHVNPHNVPSPSNVLTYEISQAQNPALTIQASADPIVDGQTVTISGVVAGAANKPVTLLAGTARHNVVTVVAKATTDGSGKYTFSAQSPTMSTAYRVRGAGKASAVLYVGVKDVLTANVSATSVQAGQALTFSGTVAPDHTGHAIYLERQNASGPGFHVVQVGAVGAGSSYSIVHTVYDVGTQVFRVEIPGGPENEGAVSAPFTIQVTPAPAAALMPEAPGNSSLPVGGQL